MTPLHRHQMNLYGRIIRSEYRQEFIHQARSHQGPEEEGEWGDSVCIRQLLRDTLNMLACGRHLIWRDPWYSIRIQVACS